ncbi:MAG: hypothetical protein GY926_19435 [bacterium]|nr:hypothetical protein [bacterium]
MSRQLEELNLYSNLLQGIVLAVDTDLHGGRPLSEFEFESWARDVHERVLKFREAGGDAAPARSNDDTAPINITPHPVVEHHCAACGRLMTLLFANCEGCRG